MKRLIQILLPLIVLGGAGYYFYYLVTTKPEPQERGFQTPTPEVDVKTLTKESYEVRLESQGTVRARTRSTLIPEVRGRVVSISNQFREGAFFETGDVLLQIDPTDYKGELVVADSSLAQAQLKLEEEKARSDQALKDWERLNPGERPNSLVLREPQLREAEANVASSQARLDMATRNLERTTIRAPYAGRVLSKNVDVGQYVSPGNQLAGIYAVDFAEVRLPLTATQYKLLDLPNIYRGEDPGLSEGPKVLLESTQAGDVNRWKGQIVLAEGAIDPSTRQLFVVAQVANPYGRTADGRPPLKVGAFVKAIIDGNSIEDVFVIARKLLRENTYVLVVDSDDYLLRKKVHIVWENDEVIVVDSGLDEGDRLCLTYVPFALEGWQVKVMSEDADTNQIVAEEVVSKRRPSSKGAGGNPFERMLAAIPSDKTLPADLKARIDAATASGDRSAIRPLMQELKAWAEKEGVELPARGVGGPGSR